MVLDIDETETISGEDTLVKVGFSVTDISKFGQLGQGRHIYFKYPTNAEKIPNKQVIYLGRDRSEADGGYVIFPGSISCKGKYEFLEGLCPETSEIQEAPDWLLEKISGSSNSTFSRSNEDLILEGSRNITLFKKASLLVDAGLDEFKILEELSRVNNTLCTPPLELEEIKRIVSSANKKTSKKKYEMTDLGNASRFADVNFENLRYCGVTNVWCELKGHFINPLNRIPYEHVKTVLAEMQKDLIESSNPSALLSWYKKSQNVARLDACLKIASNDPKLLLDQSKIDSYNSYLATQNGILSLKNKILVDQPPGQYMMQANVHFNADADCPNFIDFVQEICGGDTAMVSELQKAIGYTFQATLVTKLCSFV